MNTTVMIRLATPKDAAEMLKIYAHYVVNTAISFEYEVPSEEEFRERIESTLKRYPYIVAEQEGHIIGYAYVSIFHERKAYDWAVETSIYVDERNIHKGVGGKLHDALEQVLKIQGILNMNACIAWPDGEEDETLTKNSGEFHAHLGYRMVGEFQKCGYKFHRWYNMVWMEKIIGEHTDEQPSPIPFSQLEDIHF